MDVLIVGASSSVGLAMTGAFFQAGHRVLATSRHPPEEGMGAVVQWAALDLADSDSIHRFTVENLPDFGLLDVAIFLAGILPGLCLEQYEDAQIDHVMTVNFTGQARLTKALLPHMKSGSQIIVMSSISGERGSYDPIYAASKAAIIGFVKSLAIWLAPRVRVNALAPALIAGSTMFDEMKPDRRAYHAQKTPTQRLTTIDELAELTVQLCGPAWANLNGQVIGINGGSHV
jgi:3-oxoacyl-[acyl-carrier protein] reductase